jgi:hypothetical protein
MNFRQVIDNIRRGRQVNNIVFNPDLEIEWQSFNQQEKGYAIEFIINAYHMFFPNDGKIYEVLDDRLQTVKSVNNIPLGKRGAIGISSPDAILKEQNTKNYILVSCKHNKVGHGGGEAAKLTEFNAKVLGNLSTVRLALASANKNVKQSGDFRDIFNFEDIKRMWRDLCIELANNNNSFKNLERRNRKPIIPKDAVQKYLMEEIRDRFNTSDTVWLNAIMRSGKSYLFALTAYEFNANKVVLISHFPTDTFSQWREIFATALQYENHDLFLADEITPEDVRNSEKYVLVCSAQRVKMSAEWTLLFKETEFDFIGYDEVHYGYASDTMQEVMKDMKARRWLLMSGTIDILKSRGLVDMNNVIEWTYMDTQMCKAGYNPKIDKFKTETYDPYIKFTEAEYPTLNINHLEPDRFKVNALAELDNDEVIQSWDKIYRKPAVLMEYVKVLFGGHMIMSNKALKNTMGNMRTPADIAAGHKMIAWFCPNVEAQKTLKTVLEKFQKEHPDAECSGRLIKVFNAENEDGRFKDELLSMENDDNKYILILCGQGTTGVTFKDMPVVIIGKDTGAITTYLQTIFRVMSPMQYECERHVFDLSFGHTFVDNIAGLINNNRMNHTDEQIKQIFHYVNITEGFGRWNFEEFERQRLEAFKGRPDFLLSSIVKDTISNFDIGDIDIDIANNKSSMEIGETLKGRNNFADKKKQKLNNVLDDSEEDKDLIERDKAFQKFLLKTFMKTAIAMEVVR